MNQNEQPVAYVPSTNVVLNIALVGSITYTLGAWEITQRHSDGDPYTGLSAEVAVYRNNENKPCVYPDTVLAAAAIRIIDKVADRVFILGMEADDPELLAFDNESTMAKLRAFAASAEDFFYVEVNYEYFLKQYEAADVVMDEPVAYHGHAIGIPRKHLVIELVDVGTGQVIKPIFGQVETSSLSDSI